MKPAEKKPLTFYKVSEEKKVIFARQENEITGKG